MSNITTGRRGEQIALNYLKKQGFWIIGTDMEGLDYKDVDYEGKIAIIIGSERYGIDKKWFEYPHKNIYIPMFGEMTSLNVGVAGSILLYQAKMNR